MLFRFSVSIFSKKFLKKKICLPASPTSIGIENFSFAYSNQNSGVAPTLNIYVEFNYDFFFISDDSLFSTFLFVRLECSRIVGRPIARKKSWQGNDFDLEKAKIFFIENYSLCLKNYGFFTSIPGVLGYGLDCKTCFTASYYNIYFIFADMEVILF